MHSEADSSELVIGDPGSGGIGAAVEFRFDAQPCLGRGVADQGDDHLVADQGATPPVLGDMAEHAMLYLVPLRSSWREVTDPEPQPALVREALQGHLPEPVAA